MKVDYIQVNFTKDYGKLKFDHINRQKIRKQVIEYLKESMKEHGFLVSRAVVVDSDFRIVDGQHRYLAAKELGIEAPFIIEDVDYAKAVRDLNRVQKEWTLEDWLNYGSALGLKSYQKIQDFHSKHSELSMTAVLSICCYKPKGHFIEYSKTLKNTEEFELNPMRNKVVSLVYYCKDYIDFWHVSSFVRAIIVLVDKVSDKDIEKFKKKISLLIKQSYVDEYLALFEKIINKGRHVENRINLTSKNL